MYLKSEKKLINLHIASRVLKRLFMTLVKDCKAHLFKTITISTVIRAIKQRDWKQFVCRNKNGEFITKEHSGSWLDEKSQSSTELVECLLTLGNTEIVEPQNQILVEKSSAEPD